MSELSLMGGTSISISMHSLGVCARIHVRVRVLVFSMYTTHVDIIAETQQLYKHFNIWIWIRIETFTANSTVPSA